MFKRQGQKAANTGSASGRGKSAILRAQGSTNYCFLFIVQYTDIFLVRLNCSCSWPGKSQRRLFISRLVTWRRRSRCSGWQRKSSTVECWIIGQLFSCACTMSFHGSINTVVFFNFIYLTFKFKPLSFLVSVCDIQKIS